MGAMAVLGEAAKPDCPPPGSATLAVDDLARFFARRKDIPRKTRATSARLSMLAPVARRRCARNVKRLRHLNATTKHLTSCTTTVVSARTVTYYFVFKFLSNPHLVYSRCCILHPCVTFQNFKFSIFAFSTGPMQFSQFCVSVTPLLAANNSYRLKTSRPTTSTQRLMTDDIPMTISAITTVSKASKKNNLTN